LQCGFREIARLPADAPKRKRPSSRFREPKTAGPDHGGKTPAEPMTGRSIPPPADFENVTPAIQDKNSSAAKSLQIGH